MKAVADSIREYGFRQPIVVDEDGVILAGHTRFEAAKRLELDTAPVHVAEGLTPDQARAYRIMDNRSHENAAWDTDLLKFEFEGLRDSGFDFDLTGFTGPEINALLGPVGTTGDDDDLILPPENPVSALGDIWQCGPHRIVCGDATDKAVVEALGLKAAAMVFTSPPYLDLRTYHTGIGDWDTLMRGVFGVIPVGEETQVFVNLGLIYRKGEWFEYWRDWLVWMNDREWKRAGWYVWDKLMGAPGDHRGSPRAELRMGFPSEPSKAPIAQDEAQQVCWQDHYGYVPAAGWIVEARDANGQEVPDVQISGRDNPAVTSQGAGRERGSSRRVSRGPAVRVHRRVHR